MYTSMGTDIHVFIYMSNAGAIPYIHTYGQTLTYTSIHSRLLTLKHPHLGILLQPHNTPVLICSHTTVTHSFTHSTNEYTNTYVKTQCMFSSCTYKHTVRNTYTERTLLH